MSVRLVWWSQGDAVPQSDWYSSAARAEAAVQRWLSTLRHEDLATVVIELHEGGWIEHATAVGWPAALRVELGHGMLRGYVETFGSATMAAAS